MKILFIAQVYPPEPLDMFGELMCFLQNTGWDVTVVTGYPSHQTGGACREYSKKFLLRDNINGIDVLRTWHLMPSSRSIPARSTQFVSKALGMSLGAALLCERPDIVLVYGPPLVGPALALIAAMRHRAKLVNLVYDIYPDIAIDTGHIANPFVITAARLIEKFQYWAADKTIVLSEGFRKTLADRGVPNEKIAVVPIWQDPDEIEPRSKEVSWRRNHGISLDKFVVMFSGTVGLVSGALVIAEAASLLRAREDILFIVVGDGGLKSALLQKAMELNLNNLISMPFQPRAGLSKQLSAADVGLVTLSPGQGYTSFPSKMLAYMAAGLPIVASIDLDCDTAKEIRDYGFGLVVPPGNPETLANGLMTLADDPASREDYGTAARQRLEKHFSKDTVLWQFERVLRSVVQE